MYFKSLSIHARLQAATAQMNCVIAGVNCAAPFACKNYSGGDKATSSFCMETACAGYCSSHSLPEYCMQTHYIDAGYCTQTDGFPLKKCTVVTGILPEHVHWCQTVACETAMESCSDEGEPDCGANLRETILKRSGSFCKSSGPPSAPPTPPPTTKSTTKPSVTCSTSSSSTSSSSTTSTTSSTQNVEVPGECWALGDWSGNKPCMKCPAGQVLQGRCKEFSSQYCHASEAKCKAENGGGGDGGSGGGGSGGGYCYKTCGRDTIKEDWRPKTFRGPNCYDSKYGSRFGPNWKTSGRTGWEKYVPNATALHTLVNAFTAPAQQENPSIWGRIGCDASLAIQENLVCALELLEEKNLQFEGPKKGGAGYYAKDFANTGNEQNDRREIAAFLAHKFKETARLTAWVEQNTGYCDDSSGKWPCKAGKSYNGRGPVQISWNYNYGAFSEWFFGDKMVLLDDPDAVDPEGPLGFISAFWFWMTPRDFDFGKSLRTRDAIIHWDDGKLNDMYNDGIDYDTVAGLGLSTNVINGGEECRKVRFINSMN